MNKRIIFIEVDEDAKSFDDWKNGFEIAEETMERIAMSFRIATLREKDNDDVVWAYEVLKSMLPKNSIISEESYKKFLIEADDLGLLTCNFEEVYRKP